MKINISKHQYDTSEAKDVNAKMASINEWEVCDVDLKQDSLKALFEHNIHSAHEWINGKRKSENAIRSYGIIIDIDNDNWVSSGGQITRDMIKPLFPNTEMIIYSSQSHLKVKSGHETDGKPERFHIYFPFRNPIEYSRNGKEAEVYNNVFEYLKDKLSGKVDPSCAELSRMLFPSTDNPNKFVEYIPGDAINPEDIPSPAEPEIGTVIQESHNKPFQLGLSVKLAKACDYGPKGAITQVRHIKSKTPIYCPFCDDEESNGASAFVSIDSRGIPFIFCSHCQSVSPTGDGTYRLDKAETKELLHKADGAIAFSQKNAAGAWIRYPSGKIIKKEEKYIKQFFIDQGLFAPSEFPTYDIACDYSTDEIFLPDTESEDDNIPLLNIYRAPLVLRNASADPEVTPDQFPTINALINNVFPVASEREWFEQWASEVIRRKRVRTTFLIIGNPGTGKNLLFEEVFGRIVGLENLVTVNNENLKKEFNNYLMDGVFYVFDEVAIDMKDRLLVKEKLKKYITNPRVTVEGKGTNTQNGYKLTGNCVFLSNNDVPMQIDTPDRRYNVVRTSPEKLHTLDWYKPDLTPYIEAELPFFISYMLAKEVRHDVYNTTIDNEEKRRLQNAVKAIELQFYEAILNVDTAFFIAQQTPVTSYDDPSKRRDISDDIQKFEQDLRNHNTKGFISFKDVKDLRYRIWGNKLPSKFVLTKPPYPFKHTTNAQYGHVIKLPVH